MGESSIPGPMKVRESGCCESTKRYTEHGLELNMWACTSLLWRILGLRGRGRRYNFNCLTKDVKDFIAQTSKDLRAAQVGLV
jgi:hypothetical protein